MILISMSSMSYLICTSQWSFQVHAQKQTCPKTRSTVGLKCTCRASHYTLSCIPLLSAGKDSAQWTVPLEDMAAFEEVPSLPNSCHRFGNNMRKVKRPSVPVPHLGAAVSCSTEHESERTAAFAFKGWSPLVMFDNEVSELQLLLSVQVFW